MHKEEDAALATSPCADFSSVPAFKTSSLTPRPAVSEAGEALSLAVAAVSPSADSSPAEHTWISTSESFWHMEWGLWHPTEEGHGGGKKPLKIRECGTTISKENTINSLLGRGEAGRTYPRHGYSRLWMSCQCQSMPSSPKTQLVSIHSTWRKIFYQPLWAPSTFGTRCFAFIFPVFAFPFLHYDFCVVIINGWLTSTLHLFISVCNTVLRIMDL